MGDEIVLIDGGRKIQVSNARAQLDPSSLEGKSITTGDFGGSTEESSGSSRVEKKN
jgi:hypothetical protein